MIEMVVIAWLVRVLLHPGPAIYVLLSVWTVWGAAAALKAQWVIKPMAAGKKWFEDSLKKWRTNPFQWS